MGPQQINNMKQYTPFIVIAVCIGMYFFYISPAITDVQTLSAQKTQYADVLNKVQEVKDKRDAVLASFNSISSTDMDRLDKIVPEKFNSAFLANDLNNIASSDGVTIKSFKESTSNASNGAVTDDTVAPSYQTNIITLNLTGQYDKFLKFLSDLETSLQLVDVVNLTVVPPSGEKTTDNQFQYTMEINVYSLR